MSDYLKARIEALRKPIPKKTYDNQYFYDDGFNDALDDVLQLFAREVAMTEYFRASQALGQSL